jgi:hypothetical protein
MTARNELVTLLDGLLPTDVDVIPYARAIDAPKRSTVLVRIDEVVPDPLPQVWRGYKFALVLIAARTDPDGPADDELDALLEDVLYAIDQSDTITWDKASRAVYRDTNPAYEVTLNVPFTKEQS